LGDQVKQLEGKVAIVTGGTRGIGEAIAKAFVEEGAKVLFTGRDQLRGKAVQAALGENAFFMPVDVASETEIAAMVGKAVEYFGGVDCLVSNAGGAVPAGALLDMNTDKFWESFHIHVGSVAYGMKHAAPAMAKRGGGSIINVSSIAGSDVECGGFAYCGAKAAVTQLSKWAAMDLASKKIRVNVISPGPIVTSIFGRATAGAEAAERKKSNIVSVFQELTPLGMAGAPEDIASGAVYLAGDGAKYVTGQNLIIDGGISNSRPAEHVQEMWKRIRGAAT
jgi:NAD(P)-dependent dehydrogenase (short-subunit alcohol dehydrogenase family)